MGPNGSRPKDRNGCSGSKGNDGRRERDAKGYTLSRGKGGGETIRGGAVGSGGSERDEGPGGGLEGNPGGEFGHAHLGTGSHSRVDGKLPLSEVVLQVVEESDAHRVLHVEPFNICHIASYFSHAFPEAHNTIVQESPGVGIC